MSALNKIISLGIAAILAAAFIPTAIVQIVGANLSGASQAVTAIWGVLAIIVIVAVMLIFVKAAQDEM